MIFAQIERDRFRIEHLVAQAGQHAAFIVALFDLARVAALRAVARARADPEAIALADPARSADATLAQPGQKPFRPALIFGHVRRALGKLALRGIPYRRIDDAQFRHRLFDLVACGLRPDDRRAGSRILYLRGAKMDQHAGIEPVAQDAVAPLRVAADRRGSPQSASRPGDAISIQAFGDRDRASAGDIFGEDTNDDLRLVRIYGAQACNQPAAIVEPIRAAIAIGDACRRAPLCNAAALGTADVVRQFLPLLFVEQALDSAFERIDLTVREGKQAGAVEVQPVADMVSIALIARDAAGRIAQNLIDTAGLHPGEQGIQTGALRL